MKYWWIILCRITAIVSILYAGTHWDAPIQEFLTYVNTGGIFILLARVDELAIKYGREE